MFTSKVRVQRALTLIVVAVACSIAACSPRSSSKSEPTPVLPQLPNTTFPLPPIRTDGAGVDLGWILTNGERASLADQRGKILVLDLYATWCEPCRRSIPQLITLHQRFAAKGLQLVGLNVGGPDDRIKVPAFAAEFQISYPLGFPDQPLIELLLTDDSSLPQTFIFSREGKLLKRFIGYDDSLPRQLEDIIRGELAADGKLPQESGAEQVKN